MKPGVRKKATDFLDWNVYVRLFEVNEWIKKQSSIIHWQSSSNLLWYGKNPFAVRNNQHTKRTVFSSMHCAHGLLQSFCCVFMYVRVFLCAAIIVSGGCLCECAFLQLRICQPHHNSQAVSQSLSIVAWMKNKLYWIHYTRRSIINSHLHPLQRIAILFFRSLFLSLFLHIFTK